MISGHCGASRAEPASQSACAGAQGAAQNRAVDGDEVALRVLPPSQWHHMRGGALPSGDLLAVPASDPPLRSLRSPSHSGCSPLQSICDSPVQRMTAAHCQAADLVAGSIEPAMWCKTDFKMFTVGVVPVESWVLWCCTAARGMA
jgi:hypothetical protein